MMDGKVMKQETKDIWASGRSTKLNIKVKLDGGMHVLEVYGAEGCCDGTTTWKFKVNSGKWEDFTVTNLNRYGRAVVKINRPKITEPVNTHPCKNFNNYATQCTNYKGRHYEKLVKGFAEVDFCAVLVKTQKKSCSAYCKSQDRVCLFGVKNRNVRVVETRAATVAPGTHDASVCKGMKGY
jgi:hypothetical protein